MAGNMQHRSKGSLALCRKASLRSEATHLVRLYYLV